MFMWSRLNGEHTLCTSPMPFCASSIFGQKDPIQALVVPVICLLPPSIPHLDHTSPPLRANGLTSVGMAVEAPLAKLRPFPNDPLDQKNWSKTLQKWVIFAKLGKRRRAGNPRIVSVTAKHCRLTKGGDTMKIYVVLALALVALLTVARAESDIESTTKEGAMKSLKELKDFFSNDPMGQKLAAICKDLKEFFLLAQTKTHSAFKDYVKRLMAEES